MPLPRIAIVGRPNVGKSSLLNMLAARRVSIVDDTPGTTRDRVSAIVKLDGENPLDPPVMAEMTDTGGYGVYTVEGRRISNDGQDLAPLGKDVERQIAAAVESADLVLFVIDTQTGVIAQDREVARLLREGGLGGSKKKKKAPKDQDAKTSKSSKKKSEPSHPVSDHGRVVIIANKCDGPRWEAHAFEASTLGFGEPLIVSAKNNYHRRDLVEQLHAIVSKLPAAQPDRVGPPEARAETYIAIVGKRNAGKSTLVNTLAGEDRVIVSEIAGTTRDAVDVRFQMGDRTMVAIDTAGLRKKKSFQDRIEWWALDRAELAIDRSDVCLLMIDATEPISAVDKQLGMMIADRFKPVVIVVNKWDLAEGQPINDGLTRRGKPRPVTSGDYEKYIREELKGLWFAPIAFISAQNNKNVRATIDLAFELRQQALQRTTTGKLNRLVRGILDRQGPTSGTGAFAKLLYVAQVAVAPPTIVCVVNYPDLFTPNYQRFLLNRFREELPFEEVPMKLLIRGRRRDEIIETEQGEIARVRPNDDEQALDADVGMTAAEAEKVDWSVEDPGNDASRYFDEPLPGKKPAVGASSTPRFPKPSRPARPNREDRSPKRMRTRSRSR